MQLRIMAGEKFQEVQEAFNKIFPYLTINLSSSNLSKKLYLTENSEQSKSDDKISFIISTENTTVKEIVDQFQELFNLSVKVQRKSDGHWVETILTENWTLTKQNLEGKNLTDFNPRNLRED